MCCQSLAGARASVGTPIRNEIRFVEIIQEPFGIKHVEVVPTEEQVGDDWQRGGIASDDNSGSVMSVVISTASVWP